MRILLINPNSTAAMTDGIEKAARAAALPTTEVHAVNPEGVPPAVESYADEALCIPATLALAEAEADRWDAIIIACHSDPGIDAVRERVRNLVIGIGEASYAAALAAGRRFSLITLTARFVPRKREQIRRLGLLDRCASIRTLGAGVVEGFEGKDRLRDRYLAEAAAAVREDGADAVVLGCSGMVGIAEDLQGQLCVPIVDPVVASVKLAEAVGPLRRGRS
jgi:allantoin racemase